MAKQRLTASATGPLPPEGALLYAALGSSQATSDLYLLDPTDATETTVGPIGFALTGLAFHPITGVLYGVTSNLSAANPRSLVTVDTTTGTGTLVGSLGLANPVADCAFDSSGNLYGFRASTQTLYQINIATGAATPVPSPKIPGVVGFGGFGSDFDASDVLFVSPKGQSGLYFSVTEPAFVLTSQIALSNGPGSGSFATIGAASFTQVAQLWGIVLASNGNFLIRVNTLTGVITNVGQTIDFVDALAWDLRPSGAARYPNYPPTKTEATVLLAPSHRRSRVPHSIPRGR